MKIIQNKTIDIFNGNIIYIKKTDDIIIEKILKIVLHKEFLPLYQIGSAEKCHGLKIHYSCERFHGNFIFPTDYDYESNFDINDFEFLQILYNSGRVY